MFVETFEGEEIENKVRRIVNNKEPISDGAPIIFTMKADGVQPQYNIRTDRWDIALDAMDNVARAKIAKSKQSGKSAEQTKAVEVPIDTPNTAQPS